jgi:O-antigen/teichoic acid export membrane protein
MATRSLFFLQSLRALFSSRRAYAALLVDGLFSISSLLLTVAIAREAAVDEFGAYSFAMVVYLLVIGGTRASITETTLSKERSPQQLRTGFERVLVIAVVAVALTVGAGVLVRSPFIWIIGLALPGLLALDYVRITSSALYRPATSVVLGGIWTTCVLALSLAALVWSMHPVTVFAIWSATGSLIGIGSWIASRLPAVPKWKRDAHDDTAAAWFSLDYVAGSGGSLLTTGLLGAVVGPSVIAAIRGAGTLLGPANLIATTVRSLCLPYLAGARRSGPNRELRAAVVLTSAMVVVVAPIALSLSLMPTQIGTILLGDTWTIAQPVLLPLAIESILALAGSIAAAGHRSHFAGRRSLILRSTVGILRPVAVLTAGAMAGAQGAAWAMAAIAAINVVAWWLSYVGLVNKRNPGY